MTSTKSHVSLLWQVTLMVWVLSACVSPEEHIRAQFDTLPQTASTLLYEYGASFSSATGDCAGVFMHRWYGTAMSQEDVAEFSADYLTNHNWIIRPEEVVEIWSQENKDGLYRIGVDVFEDPKAISREQGNYQLPETVLWEAYQHLTVYLLSMTYMTSYAAKKCFGH